MATLTETNMTLADLAKIMDPNGNIGEVIEILAQSNPIIKHAVAIEGNLPTGDTFSARTKLPDVSIVSVNEGSVAGKNEYEQVTETCSMIEARSEVSLRLAKLAKDAKKLRWTEDKGFIQAMNQKFVNLLFYGNPVTSQKEFKGLANRYNDSSSGALAENTFKVGTHSGADSTSIFGVCWDESATSIITPAGSKAGLDHRDLGEQTIYESGSAATSAKKLQALVSLFTWDFGLKVKDWRQNVRIQFDVSAFIKATMDATNAKLLFDTAIDAYTAIQNPNMGRFQWYCSRATWAALWKAAEERTSSATLSRDKDIESGQPVLSLLTKPIYALDGLLLTETAIS